ncbi:MAG: glycosyltransferase family 39 protein [Acidobacteria bacterium]|nr:glycosyltransferase family 39 protein [Acidobacteriota bacterium]
MALSILLVLSVWGLVVLLEQRRNGVGWCHGAAVATVATGVLTTFFVETLSFVGLLGSISLVVCWLTAFVGAIAILFKTGGLAELDYNPFRDLRESSGGAFIVVCGVILLLVGITAVVAPPMTVDAMVYHMPKVFFWLQNGSVQLFPTGSFQQLLAPGAEYQILQWHLLVGSDVFSNLPQWLGMALSAACVALICKELGGGVSAQVIAALFVLTIPEGILQASGAKNDYVMTGWILAAVYFTLRFRREPDLFGAVLGGASIGLAVLTKGTAYPFLPALGVAGLWVGYKAVKSGLAARPSVVRDAMVLIAAVIALNAPQLARNYSVFQTLWGRAEIEPGSPCQLTNKRFGLGVVWSNAVRGLALHSSTASPAWNAAILAKATGLVELVGEKINDPATTWCGTNFELPPSRRNEIFAGNTFHLLSLALVVPLGLLLPSVWRRFPLGLGYAALLTLAFALFCGLLQWQPWHTRFHVAYFAAAAPFVGLILAEVLPSFVALAACSFWILYAGPYILLNETRPLLGADSIFGRERNDVAFNDRSYHTFPFRKAAEVALQGNCSRIGLVNIADGYDYPMMTTLRQSRPDVLIKYMKPMAETVRFERDSTKWTPCAVICIGCGNKPETWPANRAGLPEAVSFEHVSVFSGRPPVLNSGTAPAPTPAPGSAPVPPPSAVVAACTYGFADGWYPEEKTSAGYLLWMNGKAKISFLAPTDGSYLLTGQLMSVVRPNAMMLLLDGKEIHRYNITAPEGEKLNLEIMAARGAHTLEWTSNATPFAPPNDLRRLAGGLLNGTIATDGKPCRR